MLQNLIVSLNLNNTTFVRAPASAPPKIDSSPKMDPTRIYLVRHTTLFRPFLRNRADSTLSSAEMQNERSY